VDQLLIKQQVELLEAFTGFETNNKYKILNSMGQQVYFAAEGKFLTYRSPFTYTSYKSLYACLYQY